MFQSASPRTTATASIDVVPNRITSEVKSSYDYHFELMFPAMLKAKNKETGIKRP